MALTVVFYTNTALTTITLPADYGTPSSVECIGGGGAGVNAGANVGTGGAGGAYAIRANPSGFTAGGVVNCNIGTGGAHGVAPGTAGGNTWIGGSSFATATCAATGGGGATAGVGGVGSSTGSIGDTVRAGGSGGSKGLNHLAGSGGGGAAGPGGVGGAGGVDGAATGLPGSGGGGGGNTGGPGSAGASGATSTGNGGAAGDGTAGGAAGSGTNGTAGSHGSGGGGGGSTGKQGGAGGLGNESTWDSTHGPGGGGGGGGPTSSGVGGGGGLYGGGGAGGAFPSGPGGDGAQGIIVLSYTSSSTNFSGSLSDSAATSDSYAEITKATGSLSDSVATSDSLAGIVTTGLALSDSVATSDTYAETITITPSLSDSVATSESYNEALQATSSLSDSVATSDSYAMSFLATLSDTISTSDNYHAALSGVPIHEFDGTVREVLLSGGSSSELIFDQTIREVLYSSGNSPGIPINFAQTVREVLVANNYNFTNIPSPLSYGNIPIFPSLPTGFPVTISPVVDTTIGTTKSLREMRVAQQTYPLWDIEILFEELRDQTQNQVPEPPVGYTQYMELAQLFIMMYGQSGVFAFDCPWDNSRQDQPIGFGDGSSYVFNIYRTWGTGSTQTTDPVGMVNTVFDVQVGGVSVPSSHYQIIRDKIYFIDAKGFVYSPPNGYEITMTFSYYYLCRFTEDEQNFEEFSRNRWTISSLKFRAVIWQ